MERNFATYNRKKRTKRMKSGTLLVAGFSEYGYNTKVLEV